MVATGDKLELDDPIEEKVLDDITYRVYRIKADFKEKSRIKSWHFRDTRKRKD